MKDKREIIRARKAFRRSLKDEKKFLKQGKKEVRKQKKDSAGLDEKRWISAEKTDCLSCPNQIECSIEDILWKIHHR